MNDLMKGWGRVCLGSVAGAALGAASFFAVDALVPQSANASIQRSAQLIEKGNAAMTTATYKVKSTGTTSAACPYLKTAADSYASAYVLYQDNRTLALMKNAHDNHQKYC